MRGTTTFGNAFVGLNQAVIVDVETTGLDPQKDRIVSVAMIRACFADLENEKNQLSGENMDFLINPQCSIPKSASRIHGIRDDNVANERPFYEVAQDLRDFIGDCPIVGHNVSFDKRFLNAEFKRSGVKTLSRNKSFCTMRRFQDFNNGLRKGSNLDNAATALGIPRRKSSVHSVVEDAHITLQIASFFYMTDNGIPFHHIRQKDLIGVVIFLAFAVCVVLVLVYGYIVA